MYDVIVVKKTRESHENQILFARENRAKRKLQLCDDVTIHQLIFSSPILLFQLDPCQLILVSSRTCMQKKESETGADTFRLDIQLLLLAS